jgi:hypothetical protein
MISFDTVSPGIRPAEHRNKAAEEMKARLNALPAECCTPFTAGLPMQMREALAVVVRANKAAGGPCSVHRSDIADALGIKPDGAERILGRLVEVGAVECTERLKQAPLLRAVASLPASPPIVAQKAQRAPEPIRKVAGVTDDRLRANLVGMRNAGEPPKVNLLKGVVGASR